MHTTRAFAVAAVAAALLTACGGGGGSSSPTPALPGTQAPAGTQRLALSFTGTQTLARVRSPQSLDATPVTVRFQGNVVGTGTLDANGHTVIAFTAALPAGATVAVTAGSLTVTIPMATTVPATAALVTLNPDGTVSITAAADPGSTGAVAPNAPEEENETEDHDGNVEAVTAGSANVLPANAPFSLASGCGTITLTPTSSAVASLEIEEKTSDGDDDANGRFRFKGAFTGPLTFPVVAQSARLHIQIFDASGKRLIEVKAPITAFTSGAATPSPCPSPTATAAATATPG